MTSDRRWPAVACDVAQWLLVAAIFFACGNCWADETVEAPISDEDRDHWAFRPLEAARLPDQLPVAGCRSRIDGWIQAQLTEDDLTPAPEATRRTLIRRLTFDLTGLPPTESAIIEFEADESPLAYERLVDRLLASPEFGQHAAQWWLDLARFAESDGFEHDKIRPTAWRYRDWVIQSLNADLPYDQFIVLQLAGDLAQSSTDDAAVPTMFCMAGPDMPDLNDQTERRHQKLNELTSTVGSVVLGLQLGCAECHDHKYDPISQGDFYRLRAVFESAVPNLKRDAPVVELQQSPNTPQPRIWHRGDFRSPGEPVQAAMPRIADPAMQFQDLVSSSHEQPSNRSSTERLQFAQALFDPSNPLVARVIVNRLWQFHFGRGIYDTPSDAGVLPAGPTHPELLDELAMQLRENDWSMKALHRALVCSATYRQSSYDEGGSQPQLWSQRLDRDPHNRLWSRYSPRRLRGEQVRDAMLQCANAMNRTAGGPSVFPPLPAEMLSTLLKGQWIASENLADHDRRSIYVFARRNLRFPIFDVFDRPEAGTSCPVRHESTTALQSLQLLNGEFSWRMATAIAERVDHDLQTEPQKESFNRNKRRLHRLFQIMLSRPATESEMNHWVGSIAGDDDSSDRTNPAWALGLLNSNEFITID